MPEKKAIFKFNEIVCKDIIYFDGFKIIGFI